MVWFERFPQKKPLSGYVSGAASGASRAPPPRGQSLSSLLACELRDRFYSWRGASGACYVCSVFQSGEERIVADFSSSAIIGVARDGAVRRPVCVVSSRDFESLEGRALREAARSLGVCEWHVHFGVDDAKLRDIAGSRLN